MSQLAFAQSSIETNVLIYKYVVSYIITTRRSSSKSNNWDGTPSSSVYVQRSHPSSGECQTPRRDLASCPATLESSSSRVPKREPIEKPVIGMPPAPWITATGRSSLVVLKAGSLRFYRSLEWCWLRAVASLCCRELLGWRKHW